MKKIVSITILLIVMLSANIVFAADTSAGNSASAGNTNSASTNTNLAIDLQKGNTVKELQEIAVANSRQAKVDDVDIKKKEMTVRTIHSDINAMSDDILSTTKPIDVKLELDSAIRTKQDHLNQLKVDVYKTSMDIQLCLKEITLQEQKLTLEKEKLEITKARFKAKTITQDNVDSAQYNVESSEVNLTNTKEKLNSLYLDMKKYLNLPFDTTPVKIKDSIKLLSFKEIDIDSALTELYKTETSVIKAAGKYDIAKTAMELAEERYKKGDKTYDNSVMDLEEARLDYERAKTALEVKVKNKYNELKNMLDNMGLAGKYEELANKKLDNAKIKLDKGTIGKEAYISTKEVLMDAEYARISAIVNFNEVFTDLQNMLQVK